MKIILFLFLILALTDCNETQKRCSDKQESMVLDIINEVIEKGKRDPFCPLCRDSLLLAFSDTFGDACHLKVSDFILEYEKSINTEQTIRSIDWLQDWIMNNSIDPLEIDRIFYGYNYIGLGPIQESSIQFVGTVIYGGYSSEYEVDSFYINKQTLKIDSFRFTSMIIE